MKNVILAAVAALGLAFGTQAPAQAQMWTQVDNAVLQSNAVGLQGGLAAAQANSSGQAATSDALQANIGTTSDITTSLNLTSYHMLGYGAVATELGNVVVQSNIVGLQLGASLSEANAVWMAQAKATTINLGTSSSIVQSVTGYTSRH